ncbi:energy transducer TonB [Lysobacter zhanggongensis]|uniref:Energy transducer TonB n=1 Tax=Lysobacter zhanggongensis TaxID=1774951 RepID=A0ABU7YLK0_9GAMM|nr:energy transducer TonB [Lysobacter luteus]
MKLPRILIALALVCYSAVAVSGQGVVPACKDHLSPIHKVAPKLPPRLHNEFEGKAVVSYLVDINGSVQSPTIVSAEWHPAGRSSGQPVGYIEAILEAVAQWQFAPQAQTCRNQTPVEIIFGDS